jgi:flagellar protein FliO/FliZ
LIELVVRLAFSLAVVLGLVTLLARVSAKRFRGSTDAPIRVVHRQALSRGSAVAVVSVGSRVLVVGTTEQQVSLLTELDPGELDQLAPIASAAPLDERHDDRDAGSGPGADAGADFRAELAAVLGAGLEAGPETRPETGPETGPDAGQRPLPRVPGVRPAGAHKSSKVTAASRAVRASTASQGVLAGSALSAQTWRQAFAVATRRRQDAS